MMRRSEVSHDAHAGCGMHLGFAIFISVYWFVMFRLGQFVLDPFHSVLLSAVRQLLSAMSYARRTSHAAVASSSVGFSEEVETSSG